MNEFIGSLLFAFIGAAIAVAIWPSLPYWGVAGGLWLLWWIGVCIFKYERGDLNIDLDNILP